MTSATRRSRTTAALTLILATLIATTPAPAQDPPRFTLELEAGPVWQSKNDVQVPNNETATRFSLVDLAGEGPQFSWRGYLTWHLNARHSLRALYAPLSFTETGTPDGDIRFNGDTFSGGQELAATYKFNSYRLTYRYKWHDGETWRWHVGFTAKVRDAKIQLMQGTVDSTKDDVGFVPLLHVAGRYRLGSVWYLNLDVDALAGGPGRAIDGALKVGWRSGPRVAWELGYRTVEGGADVDEVYSFAWLHYAVGSVRIGF
jgi:hypothetical protein